MTSDAPATTSDPERVVRTVLIADVVESVRLIDEDETAAVRRWRQLASQVEHEIVPAWGGRMVKSLGDGLMLEFVQAQSAVKAAFDIQRLAARGNEGVASGRQMLLRIGIHTGELIADTHDVYGRSVNLAARLTTLAGPGEIVVSAEVHDQLTPSLDAEIEDLGDNAVEYLGKSHLKHLREPVRAYRVGPPGAWPVIESGTGTRPELRPTIAVIPFTARSSEPEHFVIGEMLADDIISALSRTPELHVISRLSTTVFRGRDASLDEVGGRLNAGYVLYGTYRVDGERLELRPHLAEAKSGVVVWSEPVTGRVAGIVSGRDEIIDAVVAKVGLAVIARELDRAQTGALPTLETYTLLMGAIVLMHRASGREFERARAMLEEVIKRARRQAAPHAWLANWHVLRFNRSLSEDQAEEARAALDCTKRALDADPQCSLALAIDGFVHTNLLRRLDIAEERYERALQVNPNDSLAWLLKGTLHAFKGEGELAVAGTERALQLSPLDPLRYFYESLAATAADSAGHYERAIELAQRSLRLNRMHPSTLRALAIAQSQLGQLDDARKTVGELMKLQPTLTVRSYLDSNPSGGYATGRIWADALRRAGLPA